jgi:hypothetical protein
MQVTLLAVDILCKICAVASPNASAASLFHYGNSTPGSV